MKTIRDLKLLDTYLNAHSLSQRLEALDHLDQRGLRLPITLVEDLLSLPIDQREKLALIDLTETARVVAAEDLLTAGITQWPQDLATRALRKWEKNTPHLLGYRLISLGQLAQLPQRVRFTILDLASCTDGLALLQSFLASEGFEDLSTTFQALMLRTASMWPLKDERLLNIALKICQDAKKESFPEGKALPSAMNYLIKHAEEDDLKHLLNQGLPTEDVRFYLSSLLFRRRNEGREHTKLKSILGKKPTAGNLDKWQEAWPSHVFRDRLPGELLCRGLDYAHAFALAQEKNARSAHEARRQADAHFWQYLCGMQAGRIEEILLQVDQPHLLASRLPQLATLLRQPLEVHHPRLHAAFTQAWTETSGQNASTSPLSSSSSFEPSPKAWTWALRLGTEDPATVFTPSGGLESENAKNLDRLWREEKAFLQSHRLSDLTENYSPSREQQGQKEPKNSQPAGKAQPSVGSIHSIQNKLGQQHIFTDEHAADVRQAFCKRLEEPHRFPKKAARETSETEVVKEIAEKAHSLSFWECLVEAWDQPHVGWLEPLAKAARQQPRLYQICYVVTLGRFEGIHEAALKVLDYVRTEEKPLLHAVIQALAGINSPRSLQELVHFLTRPNVDLSLQLEICRLLSTRDLMHLQSEIRSAIADLGTQLQSSELLDLREALTELLETPQDTWGGAERLQSSEAASTTDSSLQRLQGASSADQDSSSGASSNAQKFAETAPSSGSSSGWSAGSSAASSAASSAGSPTSWSPDLDQKLAAKLPHYDQLSSEVKRALRTAEFFHMTIGSHASSSRSIDLSPLIDMQYKALELFFRESFEEPTSRIIQTGKLQRKLDVIGYARPIPSAMEKFESFVEGLPTIRDIPFFSRFKLRKMLRAICQFRPGKRFTLDGLKAFALFFLCFGRKQCAYGLGKQFDLGLPSDKQLFDFVVILHKFQDARNRAAHEGFHPDTRSDLEGIWKSTADILEHVFLIKGHLQQSRPPGSDPSSPESHPAVRRTRSKQHPAA